MILENNHFQLKRLNYLVKWILKYRNLFCIIQDPKKAFVTEVQQ